MDWDALVLRPGDPVRARGRLVRNADGDWFEPPVPVPLILTTAVRRPMCAVLVAGASFTDLAGRHESGPEVEGTAMLAGTWTGSELRVACQRAAGLTGQPSHLAWDRPARTGRFPWTEREVQDVRGQLNQRWSDWNIYQCGGGYRGHVTVSLTRVPPELAEWASTLPPGILAVDPWLVPAAG